MQEQTSSSDISTGVHRFLLFLAGLSWAAYVVSWLAVLSRSEIVRGVIGGFFVFAWVFGTVAAGASVWVSLRTRRAWCVIAALISIPVAVACWWEMFSTTGTIR